MKFTYKGITFEVWDDVYMPQEDSLMIVDSLEKLEISPKTKILEIGTGCGIISVFASRFSEKIIATDINPRAIYCAKINAKNKVKFLVGDLFDPIKGKFDLIIFNPPYLPSGTCDHVSWTGGNKGREMIDRFIMESPEHLKKGGKILFVHSSLNKFDATFRMLKENGFEWEILNEKGFFFEKLQVILARGGI
ncbi:MAG: HemK2/MTQ2 family protein methyltransferase [Candidatus Hydrothermarchaeota archaeon]